MIWATTSIRQLVCKWEIGLARGEGLLSNELDVGDEVGQLHSGLVVAR